MKVAIALFSLFAISAAQIIIPQSYGYGLGYRSLFNPLITPFSTPLLPQIAAPLQSGYVAATRGSLHTAPLPEGPFAASHHINTAPAPGTI